MFRLIILVAIFFAVYPMIGNGYEQFASDFNVDALTSSISNIFNWMVGIVDNLQSEGEL